MSYLLSLLSPPLDNLFASAVWTTVFWSSFDYLTLSTFNILKNKNINWNLVLFFFIISCNGNFSNRNIDKIYISTKKIQHHIPPLYEFCFVLLYITCQYHLELYYKVHVDKDWVLAIFHFPYLPSVWHMKNIYKIAVELFIKPILKRFTKEMALNPFVKLVTSQLEKVRGWRSSLFSIVQVHDIKR